MSAFLGMRGTGDWPTDYVPESWREAMLYEYPNGKMPITGIMSQFGSESIDSIRHHWWTWSLPDQSVTCIAASSNVFIDPGLATAYVYATHQAIRGIEGQVVYVKMSAANVKHFVDGIDVILRTADHPSADVVGSVVDVTVNGSSSYIAVKLYEADDNDLTDATLYNLATVDTVINMGNSSAQGSALPRAIAYDPVEYENYTFIERTPLELTRTAMKTKVRAGDAYKDARRQCLEMHGIGMEKKALWGVRWSGTGDNGKPKSTAGGLRWFLSTYASSNISDYRYSSTYSGASWKDGGEDWLDTMIAQLFRYAPSDGVLGVCGDAALLGINQLAKDSGVFQLTSSTQSYGIKVTEWVGVFGNITLKTHPLLSQMASTRNSIIFYAPKNVRFMPMSGDDTRFEKDMQVPGVDGKVEGFLTEGTFEYRFPNQYLMLDGVGKANVV